MSAIAIETILETDQQGVLTEIANLTGNAAAAALGSMLGQTFTAKLPVVSAYATAEEAQAALLADPSVVAALDMTTKVSTEIAVLMTAADVLKLSNVLMGMAADAPSADGLSDIHMSAFGEAISQVMGGLGNGLAAFAGSRVEFTSPKTALFDATSIVQTAPSLGVGQVVGVLYELTGDASFPTLKIVQLFNDTQIKSFLQTILSEEDAVSDPVNQAPSAQSGADKVTVQPVQFSPVAGGYEGGFGIPENLNLVKDIQLNLSVELGRSEITIKEVLDLGRGSVIELNRIAGEPVDLLANGKLIAKGEVVVIEDNFGFRVTQIVSPQERMAAI